MELNLTENELGFIRYLKDRFNVREAKLKFTNDQSLCLQLGDNVVYADSADNSLEEAKQLFPGAKRYWMEDHLIEYNGISTNPGG